MSPPKGTVQTQNRLSLKTALWGYPSFIDWDKKKSSVKDDREGGSWQKTRKVPYLRSQEEKVIQGGEYAPLCQMLLTR